MSKYCGIVVMVSNRVMKLTICAAFSLLIVGQPLLKQKKLLEE